MQEKIKGFVEEKTAEGLKIDGKYYEATEKTQRFLALVPVGKEIEIDVENNQIQFINITKGKKEEPTPSKPNLFGGLIPSFRSPQDTESRVEKFKSCLRDANHILAEGMPEPSKLTPYEYAELVIKVAITLWIDKR